MWTHRWGQVNLSRAGNCCGDMVRKFPGSYSSLSFPVNKTRVTVSGASTLTSETITSSSLILARACAIYGMLPSRLNGPTMSRISAHSQFKGSLEVNRSVKASIRQKLDHQGHQERQGDRGFAGPHVGQYPWDRSLGPPEPSRSEFLCVLSDLCGERLSP